MDGENKSLLVEMYIKAIIETVTQTEKDPMNGRMEQFTKESLKMVFEMGKVV